MFSSFEIEKEKRQEPKGVRTGNKMMGKPSYHMLQFYFAINLEWLSLYKSGQQCCYLKATIIHLSCAGFCSTVFLSSADVPRCCDLGDLGCSRGEPGGCGIFLCSLEQVLSLSLLEENKLTPIY